MSFKTKNTEIISFHDYFQYRNIWMLIAILWVVFYHSPINLPYSVYSIKEIGYGGVDIFLFASGIGCHFSLQKNANIKQFLLRRANKILPMQIVFLTIFFTYQLCTTSINIMEVVGNLSGLGFFAGLVNQFNWYIGAMWACYLLAPVFSSLVSQTKPQYILLIFASLCICSICYINQFELVFWSRLPLFFLGIAAAEFSFRRTGLTLAEVILILALFLVGLAALFLFRRWYGEYLTPYGLGWYPFILITPGFTLLISMVSHCISHTKLSSVLHFMNKLGQHTLSVYFSHLFAFTVFSKLSVENYIQENTVSYILLFIAVVLFAIVLEYATALVMHLLTLLVRKVTTPSR